MLKHDRGNVSIISEAAGKNTLIKYNTSEVRYSTLFMRENAQIWTTKDTFCLQLHEMDKWVSCTSSVEFISHQFEIEPLSFIQKKPQPSLITLLIHKSTNGLLGNVSTNHLHYFEGLLCIHRQHHTKVMATRLQVNWLSGVVKFQSATNNS